MQPREVIKQNIAFACDERIGFNFTVENWKNDFINVGIEHDIKPQQWQKDNIEYYYDVWGNIWHRFQNLSKAGEIFKPVLENWEKLDSLELPELAQTKYFTKAKMLTEKDQECFRLAFMPGWVFSIARYMRSMEIYFMDLITERERIDILHNRIVDLLEKIIEQFGNLGLDGIFFCEDLGIQDRLLISPEMWRDIFRQHYERLTAKAHSYGMQVIQHSCGYNWKLIDDLCESGIDCFQFDQPSIYEQKQLAAKLKKHKVGLMSPCDVQKVLPSGDKCFIQKEIRDLVNTFYGGFIAKNYGDLKGIGVKPEWDKWAYETFLEKS